LKQTGKETSCLIILVALERIFHKNLPIFLCDDDDDDVVGHEDDDDVVYHKDNNVHDDDDSDDNHDGRCRGSHIIIF